MPEPPAQPVSEILAKWQAGDEESLRRLVPLVYGELRRIAHGHFRNERPDHTLQTTALVHEAYLCLMKQHPMDFQNREHFFAVSANLMRQILVQYARRRNAAKRNARNKVALESVRLDSAMTFFPKQTVDLVALDDALNTLAKLDAQQSRIVELRFFAGLSIEETSRVLGVSPATVKRGWTTARIWLSREMRATPPHDA
jgi:RNA polymerase sigma factor (TIGR02999 family)